MNQNSSDQKQNQDGLQRSKPIPISTSSLNFRHRSTSVSSDSSNSTTSSPPLATPKNIQLPPIPTSPSGSPTLYFLSQSPSKSPATFPFRGFAPPPVLEDEPLEDIPPQSRTRSSSSAGLFQPQSPLTDPHHERGVNVLRRLSLGSALAKTQMNVDIPQSRSPHPPPNSAVSPSPVANNRSPGRKARRSATIAEPSRQRRAPSPMGERILKGHFDGFN